MSILTKIKKDIETNYGIFIINIENFPYINNKFVDKNFHFLIKTDKNTFFLKRIPISNVEKVKNEVYYFKKIKKYINIPEIIKTKKDIYFYIDKDTDMIYILYEYIKQERVLNNKNFLNCVIDIQNKLYKKSLQKDLYNFKNHFKNFLIKSKKIKEKLNIMEGEDIAKEYIDFLSKNTEYFFNLVSHKKIKKRIIHGDLLPQNIIFGINIFIIDWENCKEYIGVIDIFRSIVFSLFNKEKKDFGLNVKRFSKIANFYFLNIKIPNPEKETAIELFIFHMLTYTNFLERVYINNQRLNKVRIQEDLFICKWLVNNYTDLKNNIF
jgi:hypothetical protein